jgi:sporulation protein YlmC with PRC-barrel domain
MRAMGDPMIEEATELIGLQVYTQHGIYLGNIDNLIFDLEKKKIDAVLIRDTNPLLVEESKNIAIPYRWIQSVGDIVILRYFPKRVSFKKASEEETEQEGESGTAEKPAEKK